MVRFCIYINIVYVYGWTRSWDALLTACMTKWEFSIFADSHLLTGGAAWMRVGKAMVTSKNRGTKQIIYDLHRRRARWGRTDRIFASSRTSITKNAKYKIISSLRL